MHSAKHHIVAATAKISCRFGRICVHTREHKEEEEEEFTCKGTIQQGEMDT
ncbi:hypothetical protein BDL97_14G035900 [Sphagnum fallax]|nr:hypothetical protein BDL97_14G035900 [Sphagnum fallax]